MVDVGSQEGTEGSRGRTVALALAVAVAVALIGFAIVYAVLAIPFYALAQATEPSQGLDRPFIRDGILRIALPAGLLSGAVTGAAVGTWYGRGGRLPADRGDERR